MDELTGFVKLDRPELAETLEEELLSEPNAIPEAVVACITRSLEESSQAEIEELFFGSSFKGLVELGERCSK